MNSVELVGRLTRDPEAKGSAMSFSLAVDRRGKDAGADYPRVVTFGKTAEIVSKYFKKGRLVSVQGSIRTGSYQNRKGETVYTTDVVGDDVRIIDWNMPKEEPKEEPKAEQQMATPDAFEEIDEDVPF